MLYSSGYDQTDSVVSNFADIDLALNPEHQRALLWLITNMRNSLELQTILDATIQRLRSALHADRVVIYQFGAGWSGEVASEALAESIPSVLGNVGSDNCFPKEYAWKYHDGRILAVDDVSNANLNPCHVDFLIRHQIQANIVVPLFQGSSLWGLLIAHQAQVRHWQSSDVKLMRFCAEPLSVAIHQAFLLKQVRQQAAREHLLFDVTQQVRASLDTEVILSTATLRLRSGLNADRVIAYQLTATGGICCSESVQSHYPSLLHQSYSQQCIPEEYLEKYRDGRTTVIDDVASQEFSPCHQMQLSEWKTRAFTIAPIQSNGRLWGLLAVHQCINSRNWLEDEVKLIRTIASQVGTAIAHTEFLTQALAQKALLSQKNAELQKARWEAEENVHLKSEFLTLVSHELRTPLNGMIGTLDLVLDDPEISGENRQLLSMGLQSSEKLLHIIDDILDFSKPESDKLSVHCQPIPLLPLVSSVCAGFKQESDRKQITIHIDIAEDQHLQANATRLHQVLNQLLANALKFTTQAGYIHIRAMHQAAQGMVHIEIHDTGIGIPIDQQKKLFQPFVQADASSNRRYEGTGLGLAICKQLVERMGGQISLFSAGRGTGTSVHIQLPTTKYPTTRAST